MSTNPRPARLTTQVRFTHMSANFLAAVAGHEQLLRHHPDFQVRAAVCFCIGPICTCL